jgi:hypothetical protein
MHLDKDTIVDWLKEQGQHAMAAKANKELPAKVDTKKDKGLLAKYGVDLDSILAKLPGGLGDKIDSLPGGLGKKLEDLL